MNAANNTISESRNANFYEDENDLWSYHENLVSQIQVAAEDGRDADEMPTELRYYLNHPLTKLKENPMHFWTKQYTSLYPTLTNIAKKYLPEVATSVPSERLFSRAGNILTGNRSRISPAHLQELLFLNSLSLKEWQLM